MSNGITNLIYTIYALAFQASDSTRLVTVNMDGDVLVVNFTAGFGTTSERRIDLVKQQQLVPALLEDLKALAVPNSPGVVQRFNTGISALDGL